MNLYRITRRTKAHVWVRCAAYGPYGPRGLSTRMTHEEFKQRYAVVPGSWDEPLFFYRKPLIEIV